MGNEQEGERRPAVLDLFAGAGGFTLGFLWSGYEPRAAIDHDPIAVETLDANFQRLGLRSLLKDLATFTPDDLRDCLREQGIRADFDVIVGGPPCQGWSKVGRGKLRKLRSDADGRRQAATYDPRNDLYESFLRYIRAFAPAAAVMENVPGMVSHNRTNVAEKIRVALEACGYHVTLAAIDAADYGVPQIRERLFFVGIRADLGIRFLFPPTLTASGRRIYPKVTVWEAIGDLPPIANGARIWRLPYPAGRTISTYAARMRAHADSETVFDHVCRSQNEQDIEAFKFLRQGGWYRDLPQRLKRYRDDIFEDKYKKLYRNRPSWCVTAHLGKDCYTHIHPTQARTISVREAARLQSFPDSFYLAGSMSTKFALLGNAVPPIVAERIGAALLEQVFHTKAGNGARRRNKEAAKRR